MDGGPCKNCSDRKLGCHGDCEKYINWHVEHVEHLQEIRRRKFIENQAASFEIENTRKATRRRNGK